MSKHLPDFSNFDCDKCGACCESLIVEAGYCDALREPKIFERATCTRQQLRDADRSVLLYDPETRACPFLHSETKECGIYATRPMCCVAVEAGDAKCQQARSAKRLGLLCDRNGNPPSRELMWASCEEYDLEPEFFVAEFFKKR